MKFAQYLNDNLVPEWKAQYLDYKGGKKKLKRINRPEFLKNNKSVTRKTPRLEANQPSNRSVLVSCRGPERRSPTQNIQPYHPHELQARANQEAPSGSPVSAPHTPRTKNDSIASAPSSFHLPSPALDDYKLTSRSSRNASASAISKKKDKDSVILPLPLKNKVPQPPQNERTPLLEPITENVDKKNTGATLKNAPDESSNSYAEGSPPVITRKKSIIDNFNDSASNVFKTFRRRSSFLNMDNISYLNSRKPSAAYNDDDFIQLQNSFDTDKKEFLLWLDSELAKINIFYKEKEESSVERYLLLQDQLYQLKEHRAKEKAKQKLEGLSGSNNVFNLFTGRRDGHQSEGTPDDESDSSTVVSQHGFNSDLADIIAAKKNKAALKIHRFELPTLPRFRFLDKDKGGSETDEAEDYEGVDLDEGDDDDEVERFRANGKASGGPQERGSAETGTSTVNDPSYNKRDYRKKVGTARSIPPYPQAKRQLKHALFEFYRSLELLKGYRTMNRTACRKMVKKFDKSTNSNSLPEFMNKVNNSYFSTSEVLDELMTKVEELFSYYLENGNRKVAIEKLRSKTKVQEHYWPLFFGGVFIGSSIPMLVFTAIRGAKLRKGHPEINYLFQIWGGFLIAVMMALAFTVHFFVWDKYKINYKFIFDFNARTALDYRQYVLMPSLFLIIGCLCSFFSFGSEAGWAQKFLPRDMPWIFVGLVLAIFLNPLRVFYYKSRRWLQVTIWRLIFSGFYPVEFKDFFIGDIFCSLTYSMSNISFFICLYATEWGNPPRCGSGRSRAMGFLSTLPSIWRLLQCFRRYADTGEWFPHLANMLKYTAGVLYYMTLSIWRFEKANGSRKAVFIIFATVNSLYSSFWDIFMDWSLMQFESKNRFLRNNLGYKNRQHLYYMAMALDVVLRFQWVFYVFFTRRIQASTMTSFGVAVAEFSRRFVWVFFRMENEHCTNVNLLKASREIPLPYPLVHRKPVPKATAREQDGESSFAGRRQPDEELRIGMHTAPQPQEGREGQVPAEAPYRLAPRARVQSLFRAVTRAMTLAHAKDFQRPKRKANLEDDGSNASSDEDDDDDDEVAEEAVLHHRGRAGGSAPQRGGTSRRRRLSHDLGDQGA